MRKEEVTPNTRPRFHRAILPALLAVALGLAFHTCRDVTGPEEPALAFVPVSIELGESRETTARLENRGERAIGPIDLLPGPVVTGSGSSVAGAQLQVEPDEIPTLNPGSSVTFTLGVLVPPDVPDGDYFVTIEARREGDVLSALAVSFLVPVPPPTGATHEIAITAGPTAPRQGDVVLYVAETRDADGNPVTDPTLTWSVVPSTTGLFDATGRFVGYAPGSAQVIARAPDLADTLSVGITARGLSGTFQLVGHRQVQDRFTSDLWLHGDHVYTGTWGCRALCGTHLYVWDARNPAAPALIDSVVVDARVVNDVKVSADGRIAALTHEFSGDAQNGVTLVDLSDPAHPAIITRFTQGLESGIHNVWVDGNYVYLVVDGIGNGLRVLNIADPANPIVVASFYADSSFLHDVYVRDGLAFLSHWDAGLVILDVGNGVAGGSPSSPVEVGRVRTAGGQTHNAWYWPAAGYVFVGEEDFGSPGVMHVVEARDLSNPREVATFRVPGATPHNFWLDEARGILYLAWYENGVRALDVSGELMGELDRQGREIASIQYGDATGCFGSNGTCTWAPQLDGGRVWASDLNTGLWVLEPNF